MLIISGIYCIKNKINEHCYIGSSKNIYRRWAVHKSSLKNNKHHSIVLKRAWDKYGEENFEFKILEECNSEILLEREQIFFNELIPEYNILKFAIGPIGKIVSDEVKNKISEKLKILWADELIKGFTDGKHTDEVKKILSIKNRNNKNAKGSVRTEEYKLNSSLSRLGSVPWNKNKKGVQEAWNKGKKDVQKHTQETKDKMSASSHKIGYEIYDENNILVKTFESTKEALIFVNGSYAGLFIALKQNKKYKNYKWIKKLA